MKKSINFYLSSLIMPNRLVICLFFAAGLFEITKTSGQTDPQDRLALVDLYNSTNGSAWIDKTNWLTASDPSTWYGITVTGTRVTAIDLYTNGLSGTLPASLSNLDNLQDLTVSGNNLSGTIPTSLSNLTQLQYLDLSLNQMSGAIPDEIYSLTNLVELRLSNNLFTGDIPKSISNLFNLQVLQLQNNHFDSGIPGELAQLSNLIDLNLSSNGFHRMDNLTNFFGNPSVFISVKNNQLQFDDIDNNLGLSNFIYSPQDSVNSNKVITLFAGEDFYVKSNVRGTNNSYNWHKDLSGGIGFAFDLFRPSVSAADAGKYFCVVDDGNGSGLTLSTRTITLKVIPCGTLTDPVEKQALVALYNSAGGPQWTNRTNWLVGDPSTWYGVIVQCGHVKFLELPNNNLVGTIPPELGNLTSLKILQLSINHLTGTIPSSLGNLRNLDKLLLDNNQLTGSIPPELGKLTVMTELFLDHNVLTGPLPDELGNLGDNLSAFIVYVNQLTGPIDVVTRLGVVRDLGLSTNKFSGHLPEAITDLPLLYNFFLAGNNVGGTIPLGMDKLVTCANFELSGNKFTGTIPSSITNMPALAELSLQDNQLTGIIPSNMGNVTTLTSLQLQHNKLTGQLPPNLFNCTQLENLDVEDNLLMDDFGTFLTAIGSFGNPPSYNSINIGFNQFSGTLPPVMGSMVNLTFLSTAGNNLTGSIPTTIGNLNKLVVLDLSRNNLSGSIPTQMGNMSELVIAEVWNNQLSGSIPSSLGSLTKLETLRLSTNQLTGLIPTTLGSLTKLKTLDLSTNQLTGPIPPQLANNTKLVYINLYENQLTGPIPTQFGNLTDLVVLDIFTNQLTGSLPKELGQCLKLTDLEVGGNQLDGTLPKELASLIKLRVLEVDHNQFTGTVPVEYLAMPLLKDLFLSHNHFTSVPNFNANLLTTLTLEQNELTFESIEPYFTNQPAVFTYAPQDSVGVKPDVVIRGGCPFTANANAGGAHNVYQWYKGGVIIPGATGATLPFAAVATTDAGYYTVAVSNTVVTGLTVNVRRTKISVNPPANTVLTEDPTNQLCNVKHLLATPSGLFAYQWFLNGKKIVGATTDKYDAYYSGNYTVTYTPDATSCSLTTPVLATAGLYSDPSPTITSLGSPISKLSTTYSAASYQWYVNNKVIANALANEMTVLYNGSYYLVAKLANGCQYRSNTITVNEVTLMDLARSAAINGDTVRLDDAHLIRLYPNPARDIVHVDVGAFKAIGIEIFDTNNKLIYRRELNDQSSVQVDVSNWSPGIYLTSIWSEEKRIWKKLVK